MRRLLFILVFLSLGGSAAAHVGHVADVAGHDHWIAAGAIGLAVLIGLWGAKSRSGDKEPSEEEETEEASEEAEA